MAAALRFVVACALAAGLAAGARAQTAPAKAYRPVAIAYYRAAERDEKLAETVKSLRAATQAADVAAIEAALSPDFAALACSPNPLKPCGPGSAKRIGGGGKPLDRLRLAFCCEGRPRADTPLSAQNETLLAILSELLSARSLGAAPEAKGLVCAPAPPAFDRALAAKAAKAAGVEPENLRVTSAETALRAAPKSDAPVAAKLAAGSLAPMATDLTADTPAGWSAIALPDGSIGYTDALAFEELAPPALCFAHQKDRWRIAVAILRM